MGVAPGAECLLLAWEPELEFLSPSFGLTECCCKCLDLWIDDLCFSLLFLSSLSFN